MAYSFNKKIFFKVDENDQWKPTHLKLKTTKLNVVINQHGNAWQKEGSLLKYQAEWLSYDVQSLEGMTGEIKSLTAFSKQSRWFTVCKMLFL